LQLYSKGTDIYKNKGDKTLLRQAILNNIYKGKEKSNQYLNYCIDYMEKNINQFANKNEKENIENGFRYINIKYES
jgi:hypothetical protein